MTASNSITVRLHLDSRPGLLAKALQAVGDQDGDVGAIDIVRADAEHTVRDVTIETLDEAHAERVVAALSQVPGVEVASWSDRTFLLHLGGKIEINSKTPVRTRDQLSMVYTPGVARVCRAIAADPAAAWNLTIKRNTVAVVSDGSAVLGLGNIGPLAAMPVMEGKAQLFKEFAGVDAFPICLDTQDTEAVIAAVTALAPGFGGINLEDIAAPRCFEIERRLQEALDIPVFHDDQHGT
ncbi:MAG TPA: NAD-dependent malic enzyme, partial [Gammaproteobacteria bacterium]|nr:NAD-dependent malic enzyme [Gammaproteobacteria bacterium]